MPNNSSKPNKAERRAKLRADARADAKRALDFCIAEARCWNTDTARNAFWQYLDRGVRRHLAKGYLRQQGRI